MDAIVAVYQDWGIGANGTQPVTLSADRRYFREKTQGAWVIVGRKTLADFPGGRPLPNRTTVVLSRSCRSIAGAQVVSSAQEAVRATAGGSPVFRHRRRRRIPEYAAVLQPGLRDPGGGLSGLGRVFSQFGPGSGLDLHPCRPALPGRGNCLPVLRI